MKKVNTEKTELALKTASSEIALFTDSCDAAVKELEKKYRDVVPDASTKDGYDYCKFVRKELSPIKADFEKKRKMLKAPIIEAGKLIDSVMNPLGARVEILYKPFETAYRKVDQEKEARKQARLNIITDGFKAFDDALVTAAGEASSVVQMLIDEMSDFDLDPKVFMERTDEAAARHGEVMEKLASMLMSAIAQEEMQAKQAEIEAREQAIIARENEQARLVQLEIIRVEEEKLARQRAIDKEAQQKAIEYAQAQAKKDAEEKHVKEMEQAAKLAEEKAEQARKQAIEQAEKAKLDERLRIEQEQAQLKFEAEKREADTKHKAAIHNEILTAILTTGISEAQGKEVIRLTATHKAGQLFIKY